MRDSNLTLKMTETEIFQILLKGEIDIDFPKQRSEAINVIAEKLTDIIYESYQNGSNNSTTNNRIKTLKFINKICQIRLHHSYENYMKCSLKEIKKSFDTVESEVMINFNKNIADDLKKYRDNVFYKNVDEYYTRKIEKEKAYARKRGMIDEDMREKLGKKYHMQVRKKYSFGTNKKHLKKLLESESCDNQKNEEDVCDSDKIVKLGYTMLNLGKMDILERIIQWISYVDKFNESERKFLRYIWTSQICSVDIFIEKNLDIFYFIIEETLLKCTTHLLGLEQEEDIRRYLSELENECSFRRIKKICGVHLNCQLKLRTLLYELYCMSFCNANVLKLCELIK
ncbi:uncharacterized protein LOC130447278 [Diorhabda sublineata]|uniref:uncharacterized protein LOC130447278 n=1 Tax=Diorhabda sublineata TaxID=1163346 RepID=UPI0024E10DFD|nr:uncharacterized protein LOC130447278 [Diorhabda sublineata]